MRLSDALAVLGLTYVKTLDRKHQHFLARDSGGSLYLIIYTRRTLRRPKALGIDYDGPMLGVRKQYLDYWLRSGNAVGIIWVIGGDAYIASNPKAILETISILASCVKRGYEVICHYPLSAAKHVVLNQGLSRFMREGGRCW